MIAAVTESNVRVTYSVKPVTRYLVKRETASPGSTIERFEVMGEFSDETAAYEAARALCSAEHRSLGYPLDDPRIQYPVRKFGSSE